MAAQHNHRNDANLSTQALVQAALGTSETSLSDMLKCIAGELNAFGCVLWELVPGSRLGAEPSALLFVNAAWFPTEKIFAVHDLPLTDSATGQVVLRQQPVILDNISQDGGARRNHPFLVENQLTQMCSVPATFGEGQRGAVNVYRQEQSPAFTAEEQGRLQQLAKLVPSLYQSIRDRVQLDLLGCVNSILHRSEIRSTDDDSRPDQSPKVLQEICESVASTFHCWEVSIFLENRLVDPGSYPVIATTWPDNAGFITRAYHRNSQEGMTGWVLEQAKPVHLFDLAHYDRDKDLIQSHYPGLHWKDRWNLKVRFHNLLSLESRYDLPPLNFMAAPILLQEQVLGVIRCCAAKSGPYYFAERDVKLLQLVAALISPWWSTRLRQQEMQKENRAWEDFAHSMAELNSFVQQELAREAPSEARIYKEALRLLPSATNGADELSVRLVDEATRELYYVATFGEHWLAGSVAEIEQRFKQRFPIDLKPAQSNGARAVQERRPVVVQDVKKVPSCFEVFKDVRREIVAPITAGDQVIGVLDIASTGKSPFPRHAEMVAKLLGEQLGLYHDLAIAMQQQRKAQTDLHSKIKELQDLQERQRRIFQDLAHQLKGPISHAQKRSQLAIERPDTSGASLNQLAIRGLCRKAARVTMSMGLLADLSSNKAVQMKQTPLDYDWLVKMLIEAAQDNELMVDPRRAVRLSVDRASFDIERLGKAKADPDLLAQAVGNILDNAVKYSFPNTVARIYGGLTGGGHFHITVANVGLRIRPHEVHQCSRDAGAVRTQC